MNILPLNFTMQQIQFAKFILTGCVSNGLGYIAFLVAIQYFSIEHKIAATLVFILSMLFNFLVNKNWTFKFNQNNRHTKWKFVATYLFGYLLNIGILGLFVDYLHYSAGLVQLVAIGFLVIYYFVLNKYFVFKQSK